MKIVRIQNNTSVVKLDDSVVAIGNFDGCHLGHQVLLDETKKIAKQQGIPAVVLSFYPLPHEYFQHDKHKLMSCTEKALFLQAAEIDYYFAIKFNYMLSQLSPEEFVQTVLVDILQARSVIVGADFCFGKNRSGTAATLQELGVKFCFDVIIIADYCDQTERISSSRVRHGLADSNFKLASDLLGRDYSITARVVHGAKLGRTLGFPTVNIPLDRRVPPLHGVYVVRVNYDGTVYYGAASIGTRPAVGGKQLLLEVYIFNFSKMIYGARINVAFLHKIRDECDFISMGALKEQIAADVVCAKNFLHNINGN